MHFGDSIFIFLLALVLFGPKKLPEIGRTIGKLLAEFRRASNEFKFQIQEELRTMEDEERRKKLAEQQAKTAAEALPATTPETLSTTPTILPPSVGAPVSTSAPFATPVEPETTPVTPIAPSAAEVIVEPSLPTTEIAVTPQVVLAPEIGATSEPPTDADLTTNTNGNHSPEAAIEPSEPVRHG